MRRKEVRLKRRSLKYQGLLPRLISATRTTRLKKGGPFDLPNTCKRLREYYALSRPLTYVGVSGSLRARTPVASNNAAARAGGTSAFAASEPPPNPLSSREICTTLISGISPIVRIL